MVNMLVVWGLQFTVMILKVFSNFNKSMILKIDVSVQ